MQLLIQAPQRYSHHIAMVKPSSDARPVRHFLP